MTTQTRKKRSQGQASRTKVKHPERKRHQQSTGDYKSILDVLGKDPNFIYRWVVDVNANGAKIQKRMNDDWEFVKAEQVVNVGEEDAAKFDYADGSVVRILGNDRFGEHMYLMRIKKEYYDEDQELKQKEVDAQLNAVWEGDPSLYDKGSRVEKTTVGNK